MPKGVPRTEETKLKISKNNARYWLGKKRDKETGKKISESNKGRNVWNKGISWSNEIKDKIRNTLQRNCDEIGKAAIHKRIRAKYGKAIKCEICMKDKEKYDWSNKDHKYSIDIKDWQQLCCKCHREHDRKFGKIGNNQFNRK